MVIPEIKLEGADLEDGESKRVLCPRCKGGSGGETSLSISREGGNLLFHCFRATCSFSGGTGERTRVLRKTVPRKSKVTPFTGTLEPLSSSWCDFLRGVVGFTEWHLELARPMYAPERHRIAYPIYGPMGDRRGYMLRSYTLGIEPKALTRMDREEPHLAWYRPDPSSNSVVIVEDIPSAVRSCKYVPQAVAMCGGGMGLDYVMEVAAHAKSVTWAFDSDATAEAIRHHRKYGLLFNNSRVLELEKDLKDMKEKDLCELMTNVRPR